jgi:hypothetical protein
MKISTKQIIMMIAIIAAFGCQSDEDSVTSPESKFLGKYKSLEPITVKIKTDYCTSGLEDVAIIQWDVTWEVKETNDPNEVDIVMIYSSNDF